MKQGYGVFGKAYEVMLRSDLHASGSIDHQLMERMILLEEDSRRCHGRVPTVNPAMKEHALYPFTRQFVGKKRGGNNRQPAAPDCRHRAKLRPSV